MTGIQLTDFLDFTFLSQPRLAPNGQDIAFVRSVCDLEGDRYRSDVWLYRADRAEALPMTGTGDVSMVRWLEEGALVYPVRNGERTSFIRQSATEGEGDLLCTFGLEVLSFEVIDRQRLLVLGCVDLENPEERPQHGADWEIFTELPFSANGRGYVSGKRRTLFLLDAREHSVTRLTPEHFEVSAYELCRTQGKVVVSGYEYRVKWDTKTGVYSYDLQGGTLEEIVPPGVYRVHAAAMLGGDYLLLGSTCRRYHASENTCVYRVDLVSHAVTLLCDTDLLAMSLGVGSDCRYGGGRLFAVGEDALYFTAVTMQDAHLFRVSARGELTQLTSGAGSVDCFDLGQDRAVFVGMRGQGLQELYSLEHSGVERRLTGFNQKCLADRAVVPPQPCDFTGSGGDLVQGWVLPPRGRKEGETYPAILDIHGGPKTAYGELYYHEMQLWASRGYFVFYCNPRGSDGRGNAYGDLIERYGTVDYDDIMQFVDTVLERYPQIDPARLGVTGGSYGGYMTNWIVGHSDRFAAAVTQRSVVDFLSDEGVTDCGFHFMPQMFPPSPRVRYEKAWSQSPLYYAKNIKTPLLIVHSDQDHRCPLSGALMLYTAVITNGVDTRMCVFKGENHELSRSGRPRSRIRRLEEITAWMDRYLMAGSGEERGGKACCQSN